MGQSLQNTYRGIALGFCVSLLLIANGTSAQRLDAAQNFRSAYGALMDSYDRVFQQEADMRGQVAVARARAAMAEVTDEELTRVFSQGAAPDLTPAVSAMQRLSALSQSALQSGLMQKSLPFPAAPTVIDACNNTPHGDQITYDALIAFQVTSGILAAAAWVCNEDILGENGSAACIPLAIANDIASSLFAVRQFCGGLDSSALIAGSYDRLDHIHTDLANARSDIINNANANTTTLNNSISASTTALTNTINAGTTSIINNDNANKDAIINNANSNRDVIVNQLRSLGCEIIRVLTTPDGLKASNIAACAGQPGYPYSWNKR